MKKFIPILTFLLLFTTVKAGTYSGGTGEPNNPYQIATVADMNEIMAHPDDWDDHFVLLNNIKMAGYTYTTALIAPDAVKKLDFYGHQGTAFTGVFDGNDHTVTGFTIHTPGAGKHYLGLFGCVDSGGVVKNLGIEGISITSGDYHPTMTIELEKVPDDMGNATDWGVIAINKQGVGGLVGVNKGIVSNCYCIGSITGGKKTKQFGGLVGVNEGTISNCYATVSVNGKDGSIALGGLVGYNIEGSITNCYGTGNITAGDNSFYLGGLVGANYGNISNCYATGSVTGPYMVGGLVGSNEGNISICYAVGSISGTSMVGGLIGYNKGTAASTFWDMQSSEIDTGVGAESTLGVLGKTTAEMQKKSTFVDAGWDFIDGMVNGPKNVWTIKEGKDYPKLVW